MKTRILQTVLTVLAGSATTQAAAGTLNEIFESPAQRVNLIELFSSEGCSSCPPADAWLAALRADGDLWKKFVPIEFHVDYWNRLGWTDRFSKSQFTERQSRYAERWRRPAVYTPGFVFNGEEWRVHDASVISERRGSGRSPGVLRARRTGARNFEVSFHPASASQGRDFTLHGALLGNGLASEVGSGENSGRTLRHEFVVLSLVASTANARPDGSYTARVELKDPEAPTRAANFSAAFWVSAGTSQAPIQATGGDLHE